MSLPRSDAETDTVTASFSMVSISGQHEEEVASSLSYRSSDPFVVRATFTIPGARPVEWVLARDLLREGVVLPSGIGDVRLFPGDQGLLLELRSHQGRAFLYGAIDPIVDFVQRIYALVPDGTEDQHFCIDRELQSVI